MRSPLRDEGAAFQVVLGTVCVGALLALASWISTWLGVATVVLLAGALVVLLARARRGRPAPSPAVGAAAAAATGVVVLLGRSGEDDAETVSRALAARAAGPVHVVVPALDTAARTWTAAREAEASAADGRLQAALRQARGAGADADGAVGPVDLVRAVSEALRGREAFAVVAARDLGADGARLET